MRRLFCVVVGVTAAACGPLEATEPASGPASGLKQAIIGGSPAPDDIEVFALGKGGGGMFCSATLIGERTLLTAAHCLDQGTDITASNRDDVKGWPGDALQVVDLRLHPRYAQGDREYDVGLLLLASKPSLVAKEWNRVPLLAAQVPRVRAIGFGETHAIEGSGVRHQVSLEVASVGPMTLYIGSDTGASTCFGDSGGPSLHRGPDGVERVVGVHSFANSAACNGGGDIRVDAIADFIDQWTRDKAPTCATDGACVQGCPTADLDCECLTDGLCSSACPLPDTDRDCPKNCLGDGVCAFGACGIPDPDCMTDGALCKSAESCSGHQCLNDAQHTESYCSRTCKTHGDCDSAMRCSFGVCKYPVLPLAALGDDCKVGQTFCSGGVCAGQSVDAATCRLSCNSGGLCPGTMKCVSGVLGVNYCQGIEVLPVVEPLPAAPGQHCGVAGGDLAALLAALMLVRVSSRSRRCSRAA